MDSWSAGWTDGRTNRLTVGWVVGRLDEQTDGQMGELTVDWRFGQMDSQINGLKVGWTD